MPVDAAVGVTLMTLPRMPFPGYARPGRPWGPSPVADLHAGGLIMFAGSSLVMTVVAVVLAAGFVRARDFSPASAPRDLEAYNAYLASLERNGAASEPG